MLLVSERLAQLGGALGSSARDRARRALYQAQCNCAYWHGLFGGLYLNALRHAVFSRLIEADAILDGAAGAAAISCERSDYDCDGQEEVVVATPDLALFLKPAAGGALAEVDYKPARFNILNTLARREEAYHRPQAPDTGAPERVATIHDRAAALTPALAAALAADRHPRYAFLDHVWAPDTTLDRLLAAEPTDAVDLAGAAYRVVATEERAAGVLVHLRWENAAAGLRIEKTYRVARERARLEVGYLLANLAPEPAALWFAVEVNLTLLAGDAPDRYYTARDARGPLVLTDTRMASRGEHADVVEVRLVDRAFGFETVLTPSAPIAWWRMPVETVSRSEVGYERTFQGSALFFHRRLAVAPAATAALAFALELRLLAA
jgi:alpha-amylase